MTTLTFRLRIALSLLGAVSIVACSDEDGAKAVDSQPVDVLDAQPGSPAQGITDPLQPSTNTPPSSIQETPEAGANAETPEAGANAETPEAGANAETPKAGANAETPKAGANAETSEAGANAETPQSSPPSDQTDQTEEQPSDSGTITAVRSSGCGTSDSLESGEYTIDVDGTMREYIVKIPDAYDPANPYKLIFAWHGRGGSAQQVAMGFRGGYYGLETQANGTAIFVAGQGLETAQGSSGWPNIGGRDIAFARTMLDWIRSNYCIDEERIFSTGMSYGGFMTSIVGCQLGDMMRAIAPMSGGGRAFVGSECVGQVAAWISHGNRDAVVSFETGLASRDHWLMANHCSSDGTPVEPAPCLEYPDCDDGYPVHFCEFDGGHTVPPFASEAIWNFFSQF